jgi:REP element-mobilizing transposase RayT
MANTYTQIFIQFVFAPKFRASLIHSSWEEELYKYITGIVQQNKHKMLAINGMPDHIHLLIGFQTTQSISDLMQDVKAYSSKWINERKLVKSRFEWQEGYGGFSYSKSQVNQVVQYILNQKEHHRKITFMEEYKEVLRKFEIQFDVRYVFREPE